MKEAIVGRRAGSAQSLSLSLLYLAVERRRAAAAGCQGLCRTPSASSAGGRPSASNTRSRGNNYWALYRIERIDGPDTLVQDMDYPNGGVTSSGSRWQRTSHCFVTRRAKSLHLPYLARSTWSATPSAPGSDDRQQSDDRTPGNSLFLYQRDTASSQLERVAIERPGLKGGRSWRSRSGGGGGRHAVKIILQVMIALVGAHVWQLL